MNWLRHLLPDNWLLGFWALLIDLLILLVIVGEILVRWQLNRSHDSADNSILDFLALETPTSYYKTVEEISLGTHTKSQKKIRASLRRLKAGHQVDRDHLGRWRKVIY
jgi:flagellar basal body-associated protein FliL